MNRSRSLVDSYYNRDISLHKPGVIPRSSRLISSITSNRHKYELKQRVFTNKSVESWFENHSQDDRRAVFSFLDTLQTVDGRHKKKEQRPKSQGSHRFNQINSTKNNVAQRRAFHTGRQDCQASNSDLEEVIQSLEKFRSPSSVQEKSIQKLSNTAPISLPSVNETKNETGSEMYGQRPATSNVKQSEIVQADNTNDKASRRYLSYTWRVTNPLEDVEQNVRPDNNTSSFFKYTKKTYPEYFFIHPDWY